MSLIPGKVATRLWEFFFYKGLLAYEGQGMKTLIKNNPFYI